MGETLLKCNDPIAFNALVKRVSDLESLSTSHKCAIDALVVRQRTIMKALKLNGIDIDLTCEIPDNNLS